MHFQLQSSPDIFGQSVPLDFADVATEPLSCGSTYISASLEISHSISPSSQNFDLSGGNGIVNVSSTGGTWSAISNNSWITVTGGASGTGNGTVTFTVSDNSAGGPRSGSRHVGGHIFSIFQLGGAPANLPPTVTAGADVTVLLPAAASLNGSSTDDGQPAPPNLMNSWSKVSGPGAMKKTKIQMGQCSQR